MEELPQFFPDEYETTLPSRHEIDPFDGEPSTWDDFKITGHLSIDRFANAWDVGQKMFSILDKLLTPASQVSPQATATAIENLYRDSLQRDTDGITNYGDGDPEKFEGTFRYNFHHLIFDLAKQIPVDDEAQEKLTRFVQAIQELPDTSQAGVTVKWKELLQIGWTARDSLNSTWAHPEGPMLRTQEERFFAFIERLTRNGTLNFTNWTKLPVGA